VHDAIFRELTSAIAGSKTRGYEQRIEQAAVAVSLALNCGCAIALLSADGDRLYPIGLHHPAAAAAKLIDVLAARGFPAGTGYAGQAIEAGAPVVIEHATLDALRAARSEFITIAERLGPGPILAMPLIGRTATLGATVCARNSPDPFSRQDQEFIFDVASVLAMAIESALLAETLDGGTLRRAPKQPSPGGLTRREREILVQLARGYTNKEVADRLILSVRTVEWHRARIQWKLHVSSRAELISAARALGLVAG
jgi:DNA-binding CsgD family transcriptional regulator